MQVQTLFGSAMARELLHHEMERDALNRNYTGDMGLFDLVGLRTGEAHLDAAVQATNYNEATLSGFAHRCIALDVAAEDEQDSRSPLNGLPHASHSFHRHCATNCRTTFGQGAASQNETLTALLGETLSSDLL